jgi:ribosomal protein S18 acetylase RimI-like enzyme
MAINIRELSQSDYPAVHALWTESEGVGLSLSDSPAYIERFLSRNPGLSLVAHEDGDLVGAVLCGHDGRRGYIYHLVVKGSHQQKGIGRLLTQGCLERLRMIGIAKCHLFIFTNNQEAVTFWRKIGWTQRQELFIMSIETAV